jgi:hypothetical protein
MPRDENLNEPKLVGVPGHVHEHEYEAHPDHEGEHGHEHGHVEPFDLRSLGTKVRYRRASDSAGRNASVF